MTWIKTCKTTCEICIFTLVFITFGSLVACFDVGILMSRRDKSQKKMFTGNSQVKTWSNWFLLPHMIPHPDSPNYQLLQLSERLRFFCCCQHIVTQWLKMAAEVLLQHINFYLSGPILSSECWKSSFHYIFFFYFRDLSNLGLPSYKLKCNIFKTIFRLSLIAVRIMCFLYSTLHSKQTS